MSKAEGVYKRQLEDWSKVVSQMNEQVSALRALSCCPTQPASYNTSSFFSSSSVPSTPQSPRAQPPLHSYTSTTNSVHSSGMKSQYFRSPIAAKVPLPQPTPSSAAFSNSTPSKQQAGSGVGATFSTPQAATGTFKSTLHRPFSTPTAVATAAATPTPSYRGNANTPGTAGTGATGAGAGMSRQYHTRHPPMATPLPNFYSSYKNSRVPNSAACSTSHASAADATARSGYSASQFGTPAPRSPLPGGGGTATASAPVVQLSEEDQQVCSQLLISQTELLESARQELSELEAKFKSLKQMQNSF